MVLETCHLAPPNKMEATKILLSMAVTEGVGCRPGCVSKLDFIHACRTCFHARAQRAIFITLPPEGHTPGHVGKLLNSNVWGKIHSTDFWDMSTRSS